ncbi:MAG: histidyl-tRNA synthetase 2 [Myxococcales bacterium]|nr:histidyl-tRNA synthetase 2 [Myxococcales bacterium]
MNAPPIRLPSGVRDFLPRAAARRRSLAGRVIEVFEAWGYARIITPVFEVADVLERGLGDGARTAAIRFVEPGTGEIVALRPDITPQIARVVATRLAEVEGPIRLCYEGAVTRLAGERGQREILQAGIELIEAGEPAGDAEVLAVAAAALAAAQLPETRLDVGHVAPARYVLGAAPDAETRTKIAAAIARKDRAGLRRAAAGLPPEIAQLAESLIGLWGPAVPTLARAIAMAWPDDVRAALDGLASTLAVFSELADQPAPAVTVDLGDVRGFDYYTGVRFAGYAGGAPEAVLRGGRYDELIARYGRAARATGFAIDLEALALAQRAVGVALPTSSVGVAVFGAGAAALARTLRAHGIRAVTAATEPTASWLRGAGFDAALLLDQNRVLRADDARRPLDTTDTRALVKLLEENRCLS